MDLNSSSLCPSFLISSHCVIVTNNMFPGNEKTFVELQKLNLFLGPERNH